MYVARQSGVSDPLASVPPAPDEYWQRFERAALRATEAAEMDAPGLPPAFVIKAIASSDTHANR